MRQGIAINRGPKAKNKPRGLQGTWGLRGEIWRRERDLNPRRCYPQRFSRPPQSAALPSLQSETVSDFYTAKQISLSRRQRFSICPLCRGINEKNNLTPPQFWNFQSFPLPRRSLLLKKYNNFPILLLIRKKLFQRTASFPCGRTARESPFPHCKRSGFKLV